MLDSILSSGDMSIGTSGITSPSSKIVLLQNYPSFESVAHALMNSGAYLQKGKDADSSSYQTGEWILSKSGVEFTSGPGGYNPDDSKNIVSSGQFENIVLSGAGVPSVDPTYNTDMQVNPSGEHGENSQDKPLIAPLGFDLMSIPQNWLIPILASSNSRLYFASDEGDNTPYKHYMNNLPTYTSYPSFNPGGFDCRKLIGQSSVQSYQMIGYSTDLVPNTSDMTSTTKGVSFSDPDQAYKACLINQLINVLARTSTGSEPIWNLENISTTNNSKNMGSPYNSNPPYIFSTGARSGPVQIFYMPSSSDKCDSDGNWPSGCRNGQGATWYYRHKSGSEQPKVESGGK